MSHFTQSSLLKALKPYLPSNPLLQKALVFFASLTSVLSIRYIYLKLRRIKYGLPPGPVGLPFVGSLISLIINEKLFYDNLASYGKISMFNFGISPCVILNDPEIASKVLKNEGCLSRTPPNKKFLGKWYGKTDVVSTLEYGKRWVNHRKLAHKNFMILLDSKTIETNVTKTLNNTVFPALNGLVKNNKLWYPSVDLHYLVFNNLFNINFGHSLGINSEDFKLYSEAMKLRFIYGGLKFLCRLVGINSSFVGRFIDNLGNDKYVMMTHDLISKWILDTTGYDIYPVKDRAKFLGDNYIKHKTSNETCIRLYINDYLNSLSSENPLSLYDCFNTIDILFLVGNDTTIVSAEYILTLLAVETESQELIYNELVNTLKSNNLKEFSFDVLNSLHYFRAFIHEGLRISSVAKIGVPRQTTSAIKVGKYIIPKNTIVMTNMKHCNVFNNNWLNNGKFNLNNFLDEKDKFRQNKNFLGFSIGKRDCPGKGVAIRTIYTIVANILLKYTIKVPNIDKKNFEIKQSYKAFVLNIEPKIGLKLSKR